MRQAASRIVRARPIRFRIVEVPMNSSAFSIKAFGVYVVLTGITLVLAPNLLLSLFGFAPTAEIWVRVVGALAMVVGYYYWACGVAGATAFFRATLVGRPLFCVLCLALVMFASAPWQLLLFGLVDLLGAGWTATALRAEARRGRT